MRFVSEWGAIKGVGAGAVQTIVENRKDGNYKSIFDLAKRTDLRAANKKHSKT